MKNKMATAALAGLALVAAGVWAQEAKTVSSGKDLYTKKCGSCHGKLGEGVPKMATMLKTTIRDLRKISVNADTLTAWKKITVEGKKKMPAFKTKLSAAEIDSSLAHMQLLAKTSAKEAKPAATDSAADAKAVEKK
ncbi:MAG: cytochrome c [candidate division Zixibacteria bacterium]|nr:cytochrome c [candidate division Zixibacteria bacterium]